MDEALLARSRDTIRAGSKSFAAAARLFDAPTRAGAVMLYAWCRHLDDVIDGQALGHEGRVQDGEGQRARLDALRDLTRRALAGEPMEDPAFAAFQHVAREHALPAGLALAHLDGFAMDVEGRAYETLEDTLDYCWGVAGVVGVMMAHVMGARGEATLRRAGDLGIAFQLTNIARDVVDDAALGRCYLPAAWLREAGVPTGEVADPAHREAVARVVARLLDVAEHYYDSALVGIAALPPRSAWAIATARGVYREIGRRVRALGPRAWDERVVVPRRRKLRHVAAGALRAAKAVAVDRRRPVPARADLWTKV